MQVKTHCLSRARIPASVFCCQVVLGMFFGATPALSQTEPHSGSAICPVTVVNGGRGGVYFNDALGVTLWRQSTFVFEPGGPGFIDADGALGMSVAFFRRKSGQLQIGGHRLDGEAKPARAYIYDHGETGIQESYLIFPTPGCWVVAVSVAGEGLTFIVSVKKVGEGPESRMNGPRLGWRISSCPDPASRLTFTELLQAKCQFL